jgi:Uma2 family endonuclease
LPEILQVAGVRVPGAGRDGGRIPDIRVWGKAPARAVWLSVAELLLVIEIVSPGSEAMDEVTKRREYAAAGIPQYWVVDRDDAQTVTLYQLASKATYAERAKMPLAWLLQTSPVDHIDSGDCRPRNLTGACALCGGNSPKACVMGSL